MLRIFKLFLVVGLVCSVGCGAARQGTGAGYLPGDEVYLLIVNDGYDQIRVYDDMSRIATVMSGRSECVKIRNPQRATQLSFSFLGARYAQGSRAGRWYAPEQVFANSPGWVWTINSRMANNSTIRMNVAPPCGGEKSDGVEYYHR